MNGAKSDLRRVGRRKYRVAPQVACAGRGARSFEEVAAPLCAQAGRLILCLLAGLTLSACASAPVEERITVDSSRLSAPPAAPPVVASTPQLPARDADIEAAGDHIAEAITSLSRRRNATPARNAPAALRALEQAEGTLTHALRDRPHDEPMREALRAALRDLNAAQRTVQRGTYADAVRDLTALNKKLDSLHGAESNNL